VPRFLADWGRERRTALSASVMLGVRADLGLGAEQDR
jgi:hypothetical protein